VNQEKTFNFKLDGCIGLEERNFNTRDKKNIPYIFQSLKTRRPLKSYNPLLLLISDKLNQEKKPTIAYI